MKILNISLSIPWLFLAFHRNIRQNVDAASSHQFAGVKVVTDAGIQFVAEEHGIALNFAVETVVRDQRLFPEELCQFDVVRGHDSRGFETGNLADEREASFVAVFGVGPFEHLIQKEEHIIATVYQLQHAFYPVQLRIKRRNAFLEVILGAHAGKQLQVRYLSVISAAWCTGQTQYQVDADGP